MHNVADEMKAQGTHSKRSFDSEHCFCRTWNHPSFLHRPAPLEIPTFIFQTLPGDETISGIASAAIQSKRKNELPQSNPQ